MNKELHDFLVDSLPQWQQNPVQFFEEVLSFYPDEWQKEAAVALKDNPKAVSYTHLDVYKRQLYIVHNLIIKEL